MLRSFALAALLLIVLFWAAIFVAASEISIASVAKADASAPEANLPVTAREGELSPPTPAIAGLDSLTDTPTVLNPNFVVHTVVSGLNLPTDMVISASGDIWVTEKGEGSSGVSLGRVRLVRAGILAPKPILTIYVNAYLDSGILAIALDPHFESNHYFYLWYASNAHSLGWQGKSTNRVSRFVFDPASDTADPASETIILDGVKWNYAHNGGDLFFDDAGNMLLSTGDARSSLSPGSNLAQKLDSLNGKVLRIRPHAEGGFDIPADNPFATNTQGIRPEIYAYGLRNPFRMTRRTSDGQIFIADVGEGAWEEVDQLVAGANYGWPSREGKCAIYQSAHNCTPNPSQFTDPVLVYSHAGGGGSGLTALAFYEGGKWPAEYNNHLFMADLDTNLLSHATLPADDQSIARFATGFPSTVDMEATADGLYLLSINEGKIRFINYRAGGNHPPTASLATSATSGKAPLSVQFTAIAEDLDHDGLRYHWDFGDGDEAVTTLPYTSHLYSKDGDYSATLQVFDSHDDSSEILSQPVQVYSGNLTEIVQSNLTESGRVLYHGGDHFSFSAKRKGGITGLDPDDPYRWTILLHHNEHTHILLNDYVTNTLEFTNTLELEVPVESHSIGVPVWYEIQLETRIKNGQLLHTSIELHPETTAIQLQSWPDQTLLMISKQPVLPWEWTTLIVGQRYLFEASDEMIYDGKIGRFHHWLLTEGWSSVNGVEGSQIMPDRQFSALAGSPRATYIALYEYVREANHIYLPVMGR